MPPRQLDANLASEPYEVRSKYQQAQIEQLSKQCEDFRKQHRTDIERITFLERERDAQDERANTAMKAIQERWKSEKVKRREDMEVWKSLNVIANLDTKLAQYDGMLEEMRWKEASRQESIAIMARDFKLEEFQAKEIDNDTLIAELEGKVQRLTKQVDKMTGQWALGQAELKEFQDDSEQLNAHVQNLEADLQNVKKLNNDLRKELRLSQHAVQAAERLKLELEGIQGENENLRAQLAEVQRGNVELKKQTEKWKKLETKNDKEARTRIDLEVAKGELEERVQELESRDKESSRELKKLRMQVKSLEGKVSDTENRLKDTQRELEEAVAASENAETELKKMALRRENESAAGPSRLNSRRLEPEPEPEDGNGNETEELEEEPLTKPIHTTKLASRRLQATKKVEKREVTPEDNSQGSDLDREEQSLQKRKVAKRKRQKSQEEDSEEEERGYNTKAKVQAKHVNEGKDKGAPRKKAKRKLNVFDGQTTFQWDSVQPGDGSLGIPLQLSPIKDGAPKRSTSFLGRLTEHMW